MRSRALRFILGLGLLMSASSAGAQDTRVSAGINFRLASGTFGGADTATILYAPAVVRVETGRFELAGFFPYLSIRNGSGAPSEGGWIPMQGAVTGAPSLGLPANGMMGGGGMMGGSSSSGAGSIPALAAPTRSRVGGAGDIVASAGYRLIDNPLSGTQVLVSGRVKIPTASASKGLGTGMADWGAAATVRRRFDSGWLYGELGYLVVGKPAGATLKNAVTWSAGGGRRLAPRLFILGSAFGNGPVLGGYDAPVEVGAGLGARLADHLYITAIPSVGLTHASPRYGVTVGLSTELWRR